MRNCSMFKNQEDRQSNCNSQTIQQWRTNRTNLRNNIHRNNRESIREDGRNIPGFDTKNDSEKEDKGHHSNLNPSANPKRIEEEEEECKRLSPWKD